MKSFPLPFSSLLVSFGAGPGPAFIVAIQGAGGVFPGIMAMWLWVTRSMWRTAGWLSMKTFIEKVWK